MSAIVSYTSRQSISSAFRIKLVDPRLPAQDLRLIYQWDSEGLLLVVSQAEGVRQVFFAADEVGRDVPAFLSTKSWASVAERCQSNLPIRELDPDAFFEKAEDELRELHAQGVLSGEGLDEALSMHADYADTLDVEGFKNYLTLDNLTDVLEQSEVYKVTDEEVHFWKVLWKAVVSKSRTLHQQTLPA